MTDSPKHFMLKVLLKYLLFCSVLQKTHFNPFENYFYNLETYVDILLYFGNFCYP